MLVALGATLLYGWWRFEPRFGIGAIVALIHDVFVTVGPLALLGKPFDLNTVAALLVGIVTGTYSTVYIARRWCSCSNDAVRRDKRSATVATNRGNAGVSERAREGRKVW